MKRIITFILLNFLCFAAFSQVVDVPLTPANDPHWELKFEDDFNIDAKDSASWKENYDSMWARKNYFANGSEAQLMMDTNIFVENGVLVLKLEKDSCQCPPDTATDLRWNWVYQHCRKQWEDSTYYYKYTGGWIETKKTAAGQYGRYGYIEAKINFPYHRKFWHAFWTFRMYEHYLSEAEIDIAEMIGEHWGYDLDWKHYTTTNVWQCYDSINRARLGDFFRPIYIPNYSWESEWHKYAVEWSPTRIIWYVDDKPVRELHNHGIEDTVRIILGVGINSGIPNIEYDPELADLTYPKRMEIDYVRVYQLKKECEEIFEAYNYDFSNYDNTVKKKIVIGNGNCSNTISTKTILRASESVEINENFTLEEGVELYIDVDGCTVDDVENIEQYRCN